MTAWRWNGSERPSFASEPGEGQESVWDYPRPPRVELDRRHVVVCNEEGLVAETRRALRVLETASPPTLYVPLADVKQGILAPATGASFCEWKGRARYWSIGGRVVAWSYDDPPPSFATLRDHVGFYPSRIACFIDGHRAMSQPGGFYAGWITPDVVGPWKGESGSENW